MCSNESPPPAKEQMTVSLGNPMAGFLPGLDQYRLHFYHYAMAERLRQLQMHPQHHGVAHAASGVPHLSLTSTGFSAPLPLYPTAPGYPSRLALSMALLHPTHQRIPEEPKPQHSYIGLIAIAILSVPEKKLVLSDIYQHILEHYPYFRSRGPGWRNSIRHNLSLNDCFVKSGRSANGKGHYWAIHPANLEDFRRGDFRRRKAQRKVRRHMGLAVDEEPDSPSPPPLPPTPPSSGGLVPSSQPITTLWNPHSVQQQPGFHGQSTLRQSRRPSSRKRQFDVASLLAPDDQVEFRPTKVIKERKERFSYSEDELQEPELEVDDEEVDVVAESNVERESPSGSPETKIVGPVNGPCNWNGQVQNAPMHLYEHIHVRNCYVPTNANTSSGV